MQQNSIVLFKSFVLLTAGGAISFGIPVAAIWLMDNAGWVSLENVVGMTLDWRFLLGSVPFILVFLAMNWHQYGSPFTLSYHRVLANTEEGVIMTRISGHFGIRYFGGAFWGQLADREHGLFFHSLPALIAILGIPLFFKRDRRSALLVVLIVFSLYLFHCFFKLWYISHPGSNRYLFTAIMLMAVPFALLLELLWNRIPSKGRSQ